MWNATNRFGLDFCGENPSNLTLARPNPDTVHGPLTMTELLIIKPSSLGDIVHGLQVATSLKAQCEELRISWIVREMFAPLVRICPAVDRVFVFERAGGAKSFLKLMSEVRKTKF